MTIRFLKPWNGYQPDAVVSGLTNEAVLIAGGLASDDLDGGNDGRTYEAKFATDASGNVTGLVGPYGSVIASIVARTAILNGASAGTDSGWIPISPNPERFAYQLDSGTTTTTFSVDISADGSTSLGQAFTGTYASSTVAEITFPIMFSNPLAKFFRWNVLSGGPLSVSRGV